MRPLGLPFALLFALCCCSARTDDDDVERKLFAGNLACIIHEDSPYPLTWKDDFYARNCPEVMRLYGEHENSLLDEAALDSARRAKRAVEDALRVK